MKANSILILVTIVSSGMSQQTKLTVKKCCKLEQVYQTEATGCANASEKFNPAVYRKINSTTDDDFTMIEGFNILEKFNVTFKMEDCSQLNGSYIPLRSKRNNVKLLKDGNLYVKRPSGSSKTYSSDQYCIDTFVWADNRTEINALICVKFYPTNSVPGHYQMSSTCMLISCFFIVLTLAVYAWLPELRNLHGMVLMAYLLSFLVGFIFMATMQILLINNKTSADICKSFTFIIYFSLLSAFFWLNVMCYDIWWTFSGKGFSPSGPASARVRFMHYSVYAFGIPLLLTILLAGLEFGLKNKISQLLPRIGVEGCFISGNSKLLYLYVPITVLCVANLVFFTLTALKIAAIKKQTQTVLQKTDKQRFLLYIKLFLVMGVNWILEVVSSCYPQADYIWKFTDAYNVLVGLVIFIIFVCKIKTLKMIRRRYRQQMGLPPLSQTTNTSISTRTLSYCTEELAMLSATNKN